MLDDVAQGDGDLTRRVEVNRSDELGNVAKGFNTFLGKLQSMITQVVSSVQKVSDSSEHTADIAIRTNTGVQKQLAAIELVATAVHEMTAIAQDAARNATHAAEALESITQAVSVINDMNMQIASAEEQSAVAEDINRNVTNIAQVANEVADGADEASQASAELTKLAVQQRRLINPFKV